MGGSGFFLVVMLLKVVPALVRAKCSVHLFAKDCLVEKMNDDLDSEILVSQRRVAQWRQMVGGGLEFRLRRCLDQLPLDHLNQLAAAAEMMSLRAGLIACGDLNLALDLAVQGDPMLARLDTDELVDSLSRFWARSGLAYRVVGTVV